MGEKIDGKFLAQGYRKKIKEYVLQRIESGKRIPCIAAVLVGNDAGSQYYVNSVTKLCSDLGVKAMNISLDEKIDEAGLIKVIEGLNKDETVDGIILQLPLPKGLNEKNILSSLSPEKDVDGLTDLNTGRFYRGDKCFVPCTPLSALELIKSTGINIEGKHSVVIGRSNIVGKPMAQLLLNENSTVTICHSKTVNLKRICQEADILIAAIGKPGFITSEFVKEGAIVIDVGTSSVNGKITGDVCFEEVISKASYVTPVPGGVGAMTTTLLLRNTCKACEENVY